MRAAQGRCMVLYAVCSFAVGEFLPLREQYPALGFVWHMVGLGVAAMASAVWATQRPAIVLRDYTASRVAFVVGFGGVFLAGVIALAIALPYRMQSAVEAVRLPGSDLQMILLLRLLALPVLGGVGSLTTAVVARYFAGLPMIVFRRGQV